jgi:hypothetical protein
MQHVGGGLMTTLEKRIVVQTIARDNQQQDKLLIKVTLPYKIVSLTQLKALFVGPVEGKSLELSVSECPAFVSKMLFRHLPGYSPEDRSIFANAMESKLVSVTVDPVFDKILIALITACDTESDPLVRVHPHGDECVDIIIVITVKVN